MENREEIVKRFDEANKKLEEIRKELSAVDHETRFKKQSIFVGKYFQQLESNEINSKYITIFYVYGIHDENCNLQAIRANYTLEDHEFFGIEDALHFDPTPQEKDFYEYKEITKEEFQTHYAQAIERIQSIIKP